LKSLATKRGGPFVDETWSALTGTSPDKSELKEVKPQTQSSELLSFVSQNKEKANKGKITTGRTKQGHMIDKFSIPCRQLHVMSWEFPADTEECKR
jgi:hypothetical protein